MSLGGATTIRLAATRPDLCRRAVLVDVTPQINDPDRRLSTAERGTVSLIDEPPVYDSFEQMAEAAVALSPHRAASGVRRGVRHNARRLEDGRWMWRYDLLGRPPDDATATAAQWVDFMSLWDDVSAITVPTLFVRGGLSPFVRNEDIAEMQRRLPSLAVETVEGAGHAVQSDRPLVLAELIRTFAL
jgi:pimeloyl-ACP methyl ester carboxylesterase